MASGFPFFQNLALTFSISTSNFHPHIERIFCPGTVHNTRHGTPTLHEALLGFPLRSHLSFVDFHIAGSMPNACEFPLVLECFFLTYLSLLLPLVFSLATLLLLPGSLPVLLCLFPYFPWWYYPLQLYFQRMPSYLITFWVSAVKLTFDDNADNPPPPMAGKFPSPFPTFHNPLFQFS